MLRVSVLVLLALAVTQAYVFGPPHFRFDKELEPQAAKTKFEFDDIWNIRPSSFMGRWYGEKLSYLTETADVILRNEDGTEETVVTGKELNDNNINQFYYSPDMEQILMVIDRKQVWRHSWTAHYRVINLADNATMDIAGGDRIQYCRWSASGHSLAYVHGNNLYYLAHAGAAPVQITTDGHPTDVFNGIPDWMYEEDVLSTSVAHYWSPDSGMMIFAKFNDTEVPKQKFKMFGPTTDVYGQIEEIAYPKAGDIRNDQPGPITKATLHIVLTSNPKIVVDIPVPESLKHKDHYYTRVAWLNNATFLVTFTNRVQNESVVQACAMNVESNVPDYECWNHFAHEVSGGWIDAPWPAPVVVSEDGMKYVIPFSQQVGNAGSWKHAALFTVEKNKTVGKELEKPRFLTNGTMEVLSIGAYNKERDEIYYLGTGGHPTKRHLYRLNMTTGSEPECMSCSVAPGKCEYVSARFSASAASYILTCAGPDIPSYSVRSTMNDSIVMDTEVNKKFTETINNKLMPTREFMEVEVGGGLKTTAEIWKPPNFDANKKYPLLIFVYGGPGSQRVMETYPLGSNIRNWLNYLKSSHDVVVASVDSRGAAARGDDYKWQMYRRLGTVEVQDQVQVAKYLKDNMPYINKDKDVAIFGWSYGGQTSSHSLADGGDTIKCAVAVAPVTDKMYYDSAYTERYMGLATTWDNAAGYNDTEVLRKAPMFKNKKYLIAHGTADDNVHFMHMAHMVNELVKQEIQFKQLMYVDQNHGIREYHHSRHLFRAMSDFLLEDCWRLHEPDPTDPPSTTSKPNSASGLNMGLLSLVLSLIGVVSIKNIIS